MPVRGDTQRGSLLTPAQKRLVVRHQKGLLRLAGILSQRAGIAASDLMFVLADSGSDVEAALATVAPRNQRAHRAPIVVPGLVRELSAWIARLATTHPIWDCRSTESGLSVIVVDAESNRALCELFR